MSDLFAEQEANNQADYNGMKLCQITPSEMVVQDNQRENRLQAETMILCSSVEILENIVIAAYQVSEYVPNLRNNQHSEFWKEQVIPNLVDCLKQDVLTRSIMSRSLSSIRDLAITIQKAGEIVKQTRGSQKSIEIAQKNIPDALRKLDTCIDLVSKMENPAIEKFGEQANVLIHIIGPEAVKYVDQKAEIEVELNQLYDKQQKFQSEIGGKQGEVSGLYHILNVTEKRVLGENEALGKIQQRTKELQRLNDEVENSIKSIPVSTARTVTTTNNRKGGMAFWKRSSSTTTSYTEMVQNPNREVEKNYYEGILSSRAARIRDNNTDEESKQRVVNDLNNSLSQTKAKYEKASKELNELQKALPNKIKIIQDQIDNNAKRIADIESNQIDTYNMVGLRGNTLIQCLIHVRTLAKSIKGCAQAYAPLVSILKGIKTMVQCDVELLLSGNPTDVFDAGNRLMKEVQFLLGYSATATTLLQSSAQYNSLANAIEFKTIALNK